VWRSRSISWMASKVAEVLREAGWESMAAR
jgi:hypothetical protein